MIFTSTVPLSIRKGTPLADYLAARFTYYSQSEWLERIAEGRVQRNGTAAAAGDTVAPKDSVAYDAGEFEEPAADLGYRIICQDDWLLGIDKPGNLLVHRAGRSFRNNLMYQLRFVREPRLPDAHPVHRLDRDTSGVVLVAKSAAARAALGKVLAEGNMEKMYYALVTGAPEKRDIDLPIGRKDLSAISYKYGVDPAGKTALTRIIGVRPAGSAHSLVTVQPVTGRTHQIRIHLAAIGAPVVGDKLYGMSEKEYLAWRENPELNSGTLPFHRHALHCASLSFVHPYTKKPLKIEAPMPRDMQDLLDTFSK
jgi:RluA family pseudouridine synthase